MSSDLQAKLDRHVAALRKCRRCPGMFPPVVSGGAVVSRVVLVGQAPGDKEPIMGRPFAWTAGRKLFRWFNDHAGVDEAAFRSHVYMAAVCRCFPGKKPTGVWPLAPAGRSMALVKSSTSGAMVRFG